MSQKYAATGQDAAVAASPGTTALIVFAPAAGAVRRGSIYDVMTGFSGTPADNALRFQCMAATALGTEGAGVTPTPTDPAYGASVDDAGENHSAEPTYTAGSEKIDIALNQRATFRWIANPGGELVFPGTASNGLGFRAFHASYTGAHEVTAHFEE